MKKHLKSWWYRPPIFTNFGDELGQIFLEMLGFEVERVPFAESEILTTGSILQRHALEPLSPGTIIWGTGWHKEPISGLPELDIRAVRGPITANALQTTGTIYGDPGLLASHFWPAEPNSQNEAHRVGFVRHYIDQTTEIPNTTLIETTWPPEDVCRSIAECEVIISSSLHGCIVAASYGIPFMRLPHNQVAGGDTKWIDFTSSLTKPIPEIQKDLIKAIRL